MILGLKASAARARLYRVRSWLARDPRLADESALRVRRPTLARSDSDRRETAMTSAYAIVTLAGVVTMVVALGFLHLVRTGLSALRDPVSGYALTRYRAAYAVAAGAAAVAGLAAALLLAGVPGTGAAVGSLLAFAAARALIPLFPMDAPGAGRSGRGRVHSILATIAFATVTASAFLAWHPLAAAGEHPLASVSLTAGLVMAVGSVIVIVGAAHPGPRRIFGLAERLIYLGFIAWFAAVAVLLGLP